MVTYFVCIDLEAKLNLGLTYQLAIAMARMLFRMNVMFDYKPRS